MNSKGEKTRLLREWEADTNASPRLHRGMLRLILELVKNAENDTALLDEDEDGSNELEEILVEEP